MTAYFKRLLLIVVILFSSVGCDQLGKVAVQKHLTPSLPISYLSDIVRLQYVENTGAFLSLDSALPAELRFWLLIILTGIAVAGMLAFILIKRSFVQPLPSLFLSLSEEGLVISSTEC